MMTKTQQSVDDNLDSPERKALLGEYYVSKEWHEADLDVIFYKQWLFAGHGTELPNPGDYFTFAVGTENLLVVRQQDGTLAAFHNLCRRRGVRIVSESSGSAVNGLLRCSCHKWGYGIDGRLVDAPGTEENFDRTEFSLRNAWVDEFHTLVFVSLSAEQPDSLAQNFSDVDLSPWELHNTKVVKELTYEIEANWKLVSENFVECYHCTVVHPELCMVYDPQLSVVGERLTMLGSVEDVPTEVAETYHEFSVEGFLRNGKQTLTMDGQFAVNQLLGAEGAHPMSAGALYGFPNFTVGLNPDFILTQSWLPLTPTRTAFRMTFIVNKDAETGRDFDEQNLTELMDITAREDLDVCALQDVVASRAYEPGPYHPELELAVINWMRTYHYNHELAGTK